MVMAKVDQELVLNQDILAGHRWIAEHRAKLQQYCLLYTSPSPRDGLLSRMPSSA